MKNDMLYVYHILMFIIYFNSGNNWFVPKCLVILAKIKYMYIVIEEEENYYFNIQIQ